MSSALKTARKLARRLADEQVDVNEVEKVLAYARRVRDVDRVREVLRRLATQDLIVYSKRTKGYIQSIQRIVGPVLPRDPDAALELLGWTARLMRYEQQRRRAGR